MLRFLGVVGGAWSNVAETDFSNRGPLYGTDKAKALLD